MIKNLDVFNGGICLKNLFILDVYLSRTLNNLKFLFI